MAIAGLENVSAISPAFFEIENRGLAGVETDHEDNNSVISEQFDLGGVERERVRQIFQEWMKCGAKGGPSNYGFGLKRRQGPQWLGENECERVRIIREWVQMNNEQINSNGSIGDGATAEVGAHIEQVCDGIVVSCPEIGARRLIRKLCGRQTLLDLLLRAHSERKRELQGLLQQRPVSDFAHRNRIQALLRGRFLRNERSIPDKRPSSVAATELGLLRQRHTVSDLREGFLSKLDNSSSTSVNNDETDSAFSKENKDENSGFHTSSDFENAADANRILQESAVRVIEAEAPALNNKGSEEEVSDQSISASITNETSLESENLNNGEPISGSSSVHEVDGDTTDLQGNMNEEFDWQVNASVQTEEFENSVVEIQDCAWQQLTSVSFTEWANNAEEQNQTQESREDWPIQDLQEAIDSWLDMPSGEVGTSIGRLATYYIPDEDNDGNIMELRELSSRRRVSSLLRSSFRETLDQVLQSFVERQDHSSLGDWESENTFSSPVLIEQNQELPGGDQISVYDDVERNPFGPSINIVTGAQPLWVGEFQSVNWPRHSSNQRLAMDWELINEMRIEMARLHQRMNDMQSMLEACTEMQIELQRMFHQEVSAALNRSTFSRDETEESRLNDESRWDLIRKGICCLCRDRKIDSLLYRCGHMCSCSSCAESMVQHTGKCPMCQAPVVEAVRAYCIQ